MFFGAVGLHADLRALSSFGLALLVLVVAVTGKIAGCLAGGALVRMPLWEALAVGCGMSARGAVGLVVAKIGLDMRVLDQELFSILVGMAVATSLLAPLMLRALAHKLPLSDEERLREKGATPGFMPAGPLRILLPAGGGDNAVIGCHLAAHLCQSDADRCTALHVEPDQPVWWRRLLRRRILPDLDTESYFGRLRAAAGPFAPHLAVRRVPRVGSALQTILTEAAHGYDLLFLGASGHAHPLYDPFISKAVRQSPCHIVLVANAKGAAVPAGFQRILVLTNGSHYADAAFEVAARYADATGASLSVLYIAEPHRPNPLLPVIEEVGEHVQDLMRVTLRQQFSERVRRPEQLECMVRESTSVLSGLLEEVEHGSYDLVLLGAENRSFVERLYLGQHIEAAVASIPCAMALVIPKFAHRSG
jgi:nucleotide-binding universal stress UspA family protein